MIVGVCGYGYTGSGAVVDLLKEYEECNVFDDFELSIAYVPDGLKDLEYHLMIQPNRFMSSDVAIRRFIEYVIGRSKGRNNDLQKGSNNTFRKLSLNYIRKITQLEWDGYWNYDFFIGGFIKRNFEFRILQNKVMRPIEKRKEIKIYPYRKMYFSIKPNAFYDITKSYMDNLISNFKGYDEKKKINVINQPFPANCPETCFDFFNNPRAIIVNRDPRDMYIFCKHIMKSSAAWIPTNNVQQFIIYYKKMREIKNDSKDVLLVNFEDLIYNYSNTVCKIENFLDIKEHNKSKQGFDPSISINNTMLFKRFAQYDSDIRVIEKELSEYIYGFPILEDNVYSGIAKDI